MLRLMLPLFESVVAAALRCEEFRAWMVAVGGPGAMVQLENLRGLAEEHCRFQGW